MERLVEAEWDLGQTMYCLPVTYQGPPREVQRPKSTIWPHPCGPCGTTATFRRVYPPSQWQYICNASALLLSDDTPVIHLQYVFPAGGQKLFLSVTIHLLSVSKPWSHTGLPILGPYYTHLLTERHSLQPQTTDEYVLFDLPMEHSGTCNSSREHTGVGMAPTLEVHVLNLGLGPCDGSSTELCSGVDPVPQVFSVFPDR